MESRLLKSDLGDLGQLMKDMNKHYNKVRQPGKSKIITFSIVLCAGNQHKEGLKI